MAEEVIARAARAAGEKRGSRRGEEERGEGEDERSGQRGGEKQRTRCEEYGEKKESRNGGDAN